MKASVEVALVGSVDPRTARPGGVRSYVLNLFRGLRSKNISARIYGVSLNGDKQQDSNFFPIAEGPRLSSTRFLGSLLLKAPWIKVQRDTIIHVQRPDHLLPFRFVKRKNLTVCTIHGNNYESILRRKGKLASGMYRFLERLSIRRADWILFVDKETQDNYLSMYPFLCEISSMTPVGIDLSEFEPNDRGGLRRKFGFGEEEKVILYVGRLEREKGLDFLIGCFAILAKEMEDAKLVIVGDGTQRQDLEDLVARLGLDRVSFKGTLSRKDVSEIMRASDVLAIPSVFEAGPIVAIESLASGTPVVSTDVGRVREFLDGENLGIVVSRDEVAFSTALRDVVGWNQGGCKKSCLEKASEFDFGKTLSGTLMAYKALESRHSRRSTQ